jgi:hypothetical protein
MPKEPDLKMSLLKEVKDLIEKQAIYLIHPPFQEGFWATFFLAPKKTGEWRPILNLKPLNQFIKPQKNSEWRR